MTLKSMTGFAQTTGSGDGYNWTIEIKSVNNKGLDVRTRLPAYLDGFDLAIKKTVSGRLSRGSVFVNITLQREEGGEKCVINEDRLDALLAVARKYQDAEGVTQASVDGLLAIKGVVEIQSHEIGTEERKTLEASLLKDIEVTTGKLIAARQDEGVRILEALQDQLTTMGALKDQAETIADDRVATMLARFQSQLEKLSGVSHPVPEDRLAQEVALLAVKADIREEIDRLTCHFDEAERLLDSGKPVGRRLDFLCQEFNREANTLCSKAGDVGLTRIGLDLKTTIDQFREQVQNIE